MWRIIAAIVGVLAAFGSTFSGVYFAARVAESERVAEQKSAFNALVSAMHSNCKYTLSIVSENAPTDEPTQILVPTVMLASAHSNIVTLGIVDEDRLTMLIRTLVDLETSWKKYNAAAQRYERPLRYVPEPPPNPPDNVPQHIRDGHARHIENWNQYKNDREVEFSQVKKLYEEYENKVRSSCDVFQETIYVR